MLHTLGVVGREVASGSIPIELSCLQYYFCRHLLCANVTPMVIGKITFCMHFFGFVNVTSKSQDKIYRVMPISIIGADRHF